MRTLQRYFPALSVRLGELANHRRHTLRNSRLRQEQFRTETLRPTAYDGYLGHNDDSESLQRAYPGPEVTSDLERAIDGNTVTVVATSRAVSLYDRSLFLAHGQDPARLDAVVVKSPHCQERFYKAWAAALVNVDAPGATSANLKSLGHTRCMRPMFPLDANVEFCPQTLIFARR